MAKVSIVIPFFKGEAYLETCIESIENQTFKDYEIIIVNDKDGHEVPDDIKEKENVKVFIAAEELDQKVIAQNEEAAKSWREIKINERVQKRLSNAEKNREKEEEANKKENVSLYRPDQLFVDEDDLMDEYEEKIGDVYPFGVSYCRNIGIKKASGKYVYFIDCDDYLLENDVLEKLVNLAEEKDALLTTGNKVASWFKPSNFDPEKAVYDSEIEGIQELKEQVLLERFKARFSGQHLLVDRETLVKNNIFFDENTRFFSDMLFTTKVIKYTQGRAWVDGSCLYIWRHRNDQIHLPALCQKKRGNQSQEFLESYLRSEAELPKDNDSLDFMLRRYFVRWFYHRYPSRIRLDLTPKYSEKMQEISKDYWKRILSEYGKVQKFILNFCKKGKFRIAKCGWSFHRWKRKKKGLFGSKIQWYRVLEKLIFKKMSVRHDYIIFESFFGKSYSDSPKYLYEYLQKTRGDKYKYIWVLNQKSDVLAKTGKHTRVKMNSLRYVYYMSRAGYRIFNVRQPAWNKKRRGVIFLETWHGTPLKKLAFDLDDITSASQNVKTLFYKHGKEWNYLISANPFSTEVFARSFVYPEEKILEYGYPRNDILYAENKDEIANEVKEEFNIPKDKRVILYAPTWRDNQFYDKGKYKFTLAMDLDRMKKEFEKDSVILLRTHYYIADILDLSEYEGFVFNGSQYEDVSRLYLASDICITDYSSVFFDFANLQRPILFFTYDYDDYADDIRGLYINMEKELPGPILRTNDELVDTLHNMDQVQAKYADRYKEFYDRFCCRDDGQASKRVIEKVFGEHEVK